MPTHEWLQRFIKEGFVFSAILSSLKFKIGELPKGPIWECKKSSTHAGLKTVQKVAINFV
jgi:hypothetical protein